MTETVYKRIEELLHSAKESRKQMAEAIGVSYRTIETSYARRSGLSIAVIKKIANHFNVSVDYLLSDAEDSLSEDEQEIQSLIEAETQGFSVDELDNYLTNKTFFNPITKTAQIFLSSGDRELLRSYHRAPKETQQVILDLLGSFSSRTAENLYQAAKKRKREQLNNKEINERAYKDWNINAIIKRNKVFSEKITMSDFSRWLYEVNEAA
jgi:transcriptional regulator with XRE-family HTH domain